MIWVLSWEYIAGISLVSPDIYLLVLYIWRRYNHGTHDSAKFSTTVRSLEQRGDRPPIDYVPLHSNGKVNRASGTPTAPTVKPTAFGNGRRRRTPNRPGGKQIIPWNASTVRQALMLLERQTNTFRCHYVLMNEYISCTLGFLWPQGWERSNNLETILDFGFRDPLMDIL